MRLLQTAEQPWQREKQRDCRHGMRCLPGPSNSPCARRSGNREALQAPETWAPGVARLQFASNSGQHPAAAQMLPALPRSTHQPAAHLLPQQMRQFRRLYRPARKTKPARRLLPFVAIMQHSMRSCSRPSSQLRQHCSRPRRRICAARTQRCGSNWILCVICEPLHLRHPWSKKSSPREPQPQSGCWHPLCSARLRP